MSKQDSAIIKGIAIILMLILHLHYIVGGDNLGNTYWLIFNCSHPITYFLIVSGYGLYSTYRKGKLKISYIANRTLKLYIAFWLVIAIFAYGLGLWLRPDKFPGDINTIVTNLIGWRWEYMPFTWFLLTYIFLSFLSKWICLLIDKIGFLSSIFISFILGIGTSFLISRYFDNYFQYHYILYHPILVLQQMFGFVIGACVARATINGKEVRLNRLIGRNYVMSLIIILLFILRGQFATGAFNSIFAISIVWLVLHIRFPNWLAKSLTSLGDNSMMMWFIHGYIGVILFQKYFIALRYPFLIFLVWVLSTYLIALALSPIHKKIINCIKL